MSFVHRKIDVEFTLQDGSVLSYTGLRISAQITQMNGEVAGQADVKIWGMTLAHMNQLSAINSTVMWYQNNRIKISAGDEINGMSQIFEGQITDGWAELNGQPNCYLHIAALSQGTKSKTSDATPTSTVGATSVVSILSGIASKIGYDLVNHDVGITLPKTYVPGTYGTQIAKICEAAHLYWSVINNKLHIWPQKSPADTNGAVLLSAETGMVGYPSYTSSGLAVTSIFNPNIQFGKTITIKSIITPANGNFIVWGIVTHVLESEMPGGAWYTQLIAYRPSNAQGA